MINNEMMYNIAMESNNEKWSQWLAGLTDGDGCFYINKKEKTVSFEITTHILDIRVLYNIKNKLKAGNLTLRSNSQSVRYRVKQKKVIFEIVKRVNGKLHDKYRIKQLKQVCELLNLPYINPPLILGKNNAYLSGLIDSNGTLTISVSKSSAENSQKSGVEGRKIRLINSKGYNQITFKITSVDLKKLNVIKDSYGFGSIYIEKVDPRNRNPKDQYHWIIRSFVDFQCIYEYLKINPLKSTKMHRIRLSLLYFKYKDLGYHLKPLGSIERKIWSKFCTSWFKYSF
uniref:Putative LAGLIDADG homing endonuclease n=1 Tax=Jenufa perforata TaxID=993091 RepID=A0A0S2LNZ6_9CHLO|nr:putative LAGLIDADG homing endonuclease [Jenufa perforata]ALO62922.1 putative LAGLIDADG homing endonuclease [Jenufa perforata]